ncbi:Protein of unknown function [Quadrisphaera sp. DSM 44207]|nr:Protein of unknown function [Quadrisphaera sp. DSM 44207]
MPAPAAAVLDVAAVLAFVLVGRRSHAEGLDLAGTLGTAWPFLAGLATGWVAARGWRAPSSRRTGAAVWAAAVAVGVLLRATTGDGAPVSFVVVTAFVLAALLLGWRVVAALVGCSGRR